MPQGTRTNDTIHKSEACIATAYKAFWQDCDSVDIEIKRLFDISVVQIIVIDVDFS